VIWHLDKKLFSLWGQEQKLALYKRKHLWN